ncbi:MAG TPA: VOC family protein [Spirochaetia bacterium]|nr:VOC family protein [Spirochaetia bacterium]
MPATTEFRVALTTSDFDRCLSFYRDVLGLSVIQEWPSSEGRGILLAVEKATLEILDLQHAAWVDQAEAGRRVSGPVRLAVGVPDVRSTLGSAVRAGASVLGGPARTPWGDTNARLSGPDGMQITLFGPDLGAGAR